MHVAGLDEPRLAGPLMGSCRLVVEGGGEVIRAHILRLGVIRIAKQILDRGANPALLSRAERLQRRDPLCRITLLGVIVFALKCDLRPASILLDEKIRGKVKTTQVRGAVDSLRASL